MGKVLLRQRIPRPIRAEVAPAQAEEKIGVVADIEQPVIVRRKQRLPLPKASIGAVVSMPSIVEATVPAPAIHAAVVYAPAIQAAVEEEEAAPTTGETGTARTKEELMYIFRDGQLANSITAQDMRDFVETAITGEVAGEVWQFGAPVTY